MLPLTLTSATLLVALGHTKLKFVALRKSLSIQLLCATCGPVVF